MHALPYRAQGRKPRNRFTLSDGSLKSDFGGCVTGPSAASDSWTPSSPLARNVMGLRSLRARARRRNLPPFGSLPARSRGRGRAHDLLRGYPHLASPPSTSAQFRACTGASQRFFSSGRGVKGDRRTLSFKPDKSCYRESCTAGPRGNCGHDEDLTCENPRPSPERGCVCAVAASR
jgi:hypothetical protein